MPGSGGIVGRLVGRRAAAIASSRAAASAGSGTQITLPSSIENSIAARALRQPLLAGSVSSSASAACAAEHEVELPGQVGGVADARAHALPGERRHLVGGVAGEEHSAARHCSA